MKYLLVGVMLALAASAQAEERNWSVGGTKAINDYQDAYQAGAKQSKLDGFSRRIEGAANEESLGGQRGSLGKHGDANFNRNDRDGDGNQDRGWGQHSDDN